MDQRPLSWSRDARVLIFAGGGPTTGEDVLMLRDNKMEPLLASPAAERGATLSPDGRWLAYAYFDTGSALQVRVQAFPEPHGTWQITTEGGESPLWSYDGRELFYRIKDKVMAVKVSTSSGFSASKPVKLFEGEYQVEISHPNYDIAPDGRFLMVQLGLQESAPTLINVVLNWTALLQR